jgi:spore germination cell wall hydrolase CwlJ-like protein
MNKNKLLTCFKMGITTMLLIGCGSCNLNNSINVNPPIAEKIVIKPKPKPEPWILEKPVTKEDITCLAKTIYFESRSEPIDGQFAVAEVVMRRVSNPKFPNSICKVISQGSKRLGKRCAFSWMCDGKSDRPRNKKAFETSLTIAKMVTSPKYQPRFTKSTFYHATYVNPVWNKGMVVVNKIGNHIFYL